MRKNLLKLKLNIKKELSLKDAELDKKDAEITINQAQYKKQLAEKDQTHAIELAEKDEEIARLNALLKTNGIS